MGKAILIPDLTFSQNIGQVGVTDNNTPVYVPVTFISISGNTEGNIGATMQLSATILPVNASNKKVTWQSSDTSILTVNSAGFVTLKAEGNATITATSVSETAVSATKTITVTDASLEPGSPLALYKSYIKESGRPETPQLLAMLNELKDNGLLDKLDAFYYLAGTSINQILINLINAQGTALVSGNAGYQYSVDANGVKSTGIYKGVLQCSGFLMHLKSNLCFGVYTTMDCPTQQAVCGFSYNSNQGFAIFPGQNYGNILQWGGMSLVKPENLSTLDLQGCYFVSYDANSGNGYYLTDNADTMFNRKTDVDLPQESLHPLGILAANDGGANPARFGTIASEKFAFLSNKNNLTLPELKNMRTILCKYAALL